MKNKVLDAIQLELTWLNHDDSTSWLLGINKFLFTKNFDYHFFMEFNDVFRDETSYGNFQKFVRDIGCKQYVINPLNIQDLDTIMVHVDTNLVDYHAITTEPNSEFGFDILGSYFLQYDETSNWCFIHSRSDDTIFIGLQAHVAKPFLDAFDGSIMDYEAMKKFQALIYGFQLGAVHTDVLKRYKNPTSFELPQSNLPMNPRIDYEMRIDFGDSESIKPD